MAEKYYISTKSDKAQKRISNVSSSLFSDKQSRIYVVVPVFKK